MQMMKLMFGYFGEDESRKIHLLYKHIDFCASGIFHQHELFTELRFRDLKSIVYPENYIFTCKYFDFKEYLPQLEAISGLNLEDEDDAEKFIAHDLSALKFVSFSSPQRDLHIPESVGFEAVFTQLTNVTVIKMDGGCIDEEFVTALLNLKHLRVASFRESNPQDAGIQMLLEKAELLEELDIANPNTSLELDYLFEKIKRPLKLTKLNAEGHDISEEFFVNIVAAAKFLPNLKDLTISPYDINDENLWKNFFNSFTQLTSLNLADQSLTEPILSHIHALKNLQSLQSNLKTTKGLELLPTLKTLKITCLDKRLELDISNLEHLEFLCIECMYSSILISFENDNSLQNLKRINITIEDNIERIVNELIQISKKRPKIKFSLSSNIRIPQSTFEQILSCPAFDELSCQSEVDIPNSIENNTSLKSLTLQKAKLDNFTILQKNKSLEILNLYTADCMDCNNVSEICDLFRNSQAMHISLVDPFVFGDLD